MAQERKRVLVSHLSGLLIWGAKKIDVAFSAAVTQSLRSYLACVACVSLAKRIFNFCLFPSYFSSFFSSFAWNRCFLHLQLLHPPSFCLHSSDSSPLQRRTCVLEVLSLEVLVSGAAAGMKQLSGAAFCKSQGFFGWISATFWSVRRLWSVSSNQQKSRQSLLQSVFENLPEATYYVSCHLYIKWSKT